MALHLLKRRDDISPPPRKRLSAYLIVAGMTVVVAATLTFAIGINHQTLHAFPVPNRSAYVPAPDPIKAAEDGLPPTSTTSKPAAPSSTIRTIEVVSGRVVLLAGGKAVRSISTTPTTLPELAAAVRDDTWISASGDVFELHAALVLEPQATFTIAAPVVRELHLADVPGVILGARDAHLTITGATVTSWGNGPVTDHTTNQPRPSVMAGYGAVLTVSQAIFNGLGWDWNGSYGVSWMSHSTGSATGSTFEHSFIGVYTDQVDGVRFEGDDFRSNQLYGLDPHSFSSNLLIRHVTAEGNQGNGIIFSNHVTASVIEDSISKGNGENGVMMDATSTGNTIRRNVVAGNSGDGIVLANSPANQVQSNRIDHNRVGVHASGSGADSQVLAGNVITNNLMASQGLVVPLSNTVTSNGGEWLPDRVMIVWLYSVANLVVLALVTWLLRSRSSNYHRGADETFRTSGVRVSREGN